MVLLKRPASYFASWPRRSCGPRALELVEVEGAALALLAA